jgi:hypothetical protein
MDLQEQINELKRAESEFSVCILELSDSEFIKKMDEWTPRDILAHLVGWNRLTISGCQQIKMGELPAYFDDSPNDYSNVNAEAIETYILLNRGLLLEELQNSTLALQNYLQFLDPGDWRNDFGVRHEGHIITIENSVQALIDDYDDHHQRIEEWKGS